MHAVRMSSIRGARVRSLVGHGNGRDMHEDPQITTTDRPERVKLEHGMVFASILWSPPSPRRSHGHDHWRSTHRTPRGRALGSRFAITVRTGRGSSRLALAVFLGGFATLTVARAADRCLPRFLRSRRVMRYDRRSTDVREVPDQRRHGPRWDLLHSVTSKQVNTMARITSSTFLHNVRDRPTYIYGVGRPTANESC